MSIIIIFLTIMLLSHTTFVPFDTVSQKSDELNTKTIETYIAEETTEEVAESEHTTEATTESTTEDVTTEATTEATTEEVIVEEQTTEAITEETTTEATTETTTDATTEEVVQEPTTAGDLGILSIPDAGIYVGLYSDANAFQSIGKASVQYYTQYGVKWIVDHVNQDGFGNLKYLSVGSKVYINDREYTIVDSVYAADYYSNFAAWLPYISESTLVLQTCEGDGARLVRCQ